MSQREIKLWLIDIRDAVDYIKSFVEGLDFEKYPTIPWREVKGFRNYVVHEYFGLDADIIWQVIQVDLPPFRDEISRILNSEGID